MRKLTFKHLLSITLCWFIVPAVGFSKEPAVNPEQVNTIVSKYQPTMTHIAQSLWEWRELGFLEHKSSALMQQVLNEHGFNVRNNVAGMPTAFVAEYGTTGPVIGLLAEMDALPGIGVESAPEKISLLEDGQATPGHACGHNLFAGGVIGAAISIAEYLRSNNMEGRIKVFGTPAEEGGSGKVYLARSNELNDVDIVLHWHPGDRTSASPSSSLANKSGKFRFYGVSAHAAAAPDKGRSALDGVEAMNMMVNLMREHVPDSTRMHYVITHGGSAPNVVPDFAEVYYYVRSPSPEVVISLWERVTKAAQGAALGTETRVESEVIGGVWNVLPNVTLSHIVDRALATSPLPALSSEDVDFAKQISKTLDHSFDSTRHGLPTPFSEHIAIWSASTDVGDISWQVPTAGFSVATWVDGTPPHTWQAAAMSGMNIGFKGMYMAAHTLSVTALSLYTSPEYIKKAKEEFEQRRNGTHYQPMIGDRAPALNYRE